MIKFFKNQKESTNAKHQKMVSAINSKCGPSKERLFTHWSVLANKMGIDKSKVNKNGLRIIFELSKYWFITSHLKEISWSEKKIRKCKQILYEPVSDHKT